MVGGRGVLQEPGQDVLQRYDDLRIRALRARLEHLGTGQRQAAVDALEALAAPA